MSTSILPIKTCKQSSKTKKRVLLTCGRIPTALYLARALHKAGAEVHIADPFLVHICKATNSVKECHTITSPAKDRAAYKKEILDIINKHRIDLVIPVFEEGIMLSECYDDIASRSNLVISNFNLLLQLHNKFEFMMLANSLALPTPKTYKYDFPTDDFEFIKNTKYVIKKIFSRAGNGFRIFEAGETIDPTIQANGEYIIQEFIAGDMVCTCSYVLNGKLVLHTAYKQLILTPNGTAAVCFQAVENLKIKQSIESFMAKIGYSGWISFDIIQKPNGDFFYIECNPRTSIGMYLFDPNIMAQTLLETQHENKFCNAACIDTKAQMVLVSIECILRRLFKGKLQLKELKSLFSAKDLTFDLTDLYPSIYQFLCYFYVKYLAVKSNTSFLFVATRDLEWNDTI